MMNPIWAIVALLLHRRVLKAVGRQDTFASADEFLSSSATEFVGIGTVPLSRKTEVGHVATSDQPLDAVLAGQALHSRERNVSLAHADCQKLRRDFAGSRSPQACLPRSRG
ncbi:hypothetical protein V8E36_009958 [Tilletia maclaganii]